MNAEMEVKLRKNGAAEEMVEAFLAIRGGLLELLRQNQEQSGSPAEGNLQSAARASNEKRKRRSGLRSEKKKFDPAMEQQGVVQKEKEESVSNEQLQKSPVLEENDPSMPCPVCQVRMKRERIPYHIERCLAVQEEREANGDRGDLPRAPTQYALPTSQLNTLSTLTSSKHPDPSNALPLGNKLIPIALNAAFNSTSSTTAAQTQKNPLPKPNYAQMKEKTLRDKLVKLSIPSHGSKAVMQARHIEWVNMYNANLDSLRPKSHQQLVNDLKSWEKSQLTVSGGDSSGTKTPGWSDRWSRDNRESYEELVKVAREGVKRRRLGEVGLGTEVMGENEDGGREGGETGNADWVNELPPDNPINSDIGEHEEESKVGDNERVDDHVDKDITPISISSLTPPSIDRALSKPPTPPPIPPNSPPLSPPSQSMKTPADEQEQDQEQEQEQEQDPYAFPPSSQNYKQPQQPLSYPGQQSPHTLPPYDHSTFTTTITISTSPTASPHSPVQQPQSPLPPHPRLPKRTRSQMEI